MSGSDHDSLAEGNRRKAANRSVGRALMRCPRKIPLADGNSLWCEHCKRVVGFMHLPKRSKPTT